jgi:hypothetical protein
VLEDEDWPRWMVQKTFVAFLPDLLLWIDGPYSAEKCIVQDTEAITNMKIIFIIKRKSL